MQAGEEKFSACENLAKRLESIDRDVSIVDVKARLIEEWMSLIKAFEERDKKLESAAKSHRSLPRAISGNMKVLRTIL